MALWSEDDLERIGDADHVQIVTCRPDGALRRAVTIWVVRVGEELYIRAVRGRFAGWFQAACHQPEGHIMADGKTYEVQFEAVDPELSDRIDEAYRVKYRDKSPTHLEPIMTSSAQQATLRLVPVG